MAKRGSDKNPKSASRKTTEHWKTEPDAHDYPAAADYLSLLLCDADVDQLVGELKNAPISHRKAKDLLRASRLPLLGSENFHVAEDLQKVRLGERLSPVLLVRGDLTSDVALTVADGYHRICASYHLNENAEIPCRLAECVHPVPPSDASALSGATSAVAAADTPSVNDGS